MCIRDSCTSLEIGDYTDKDKEFKNLLYQIRPAFGGNIVATIVNPEHRPQMATVRPGVMKKEIYKADHKGEVINHAVADFVRDEDFVIEIIDRHVAKSKINLGGAPIIVSGGYGVGSAESFKLLHELAELLGGEVGATRAAVDAGFTEHERQIGQTGVTAVSYTHLDVYKRQLHETPCGVASYVCVAPCRSSADA